jgi:hypothetical protein
MHPQLLVSWLSKKHWDKFKVPGSWFGGLEVDRGAVYVRLLGLEMMFIANAGIGVMKNQVSGTMGHGFVGDEDGGGESCQN